MTSKAADTRRGLAWLELALALHEGPVTSSHVLKRVGEGVSRASELCTTSKRFLSLYLNSH